MGSNGQVLTPKLPTPGRPTPAPATPQHAPQEEPLVDAVQEVPVTETPQSQAEETVQEVPAAEVAQSSTKKAVRLTPAGKAAQLTPATKMPQSSVKKAVQTTPRGKVPGSSVEKAEQVDSQVAAAQEMPRATTFQNVDAQYIEQLRQEAGKPPVWKSKMFIFACVGLAVVCVICGVLVVQHNAEQDAKREKYAQIRKVQLRAHAINKQNIETLAEAKEKNVNVKCTKAEARLLMQIVVNPEMKDDEGKPLCVGHPDGVAQLACLLLGIASEENEDICKYVFERLNKDAAKIKSTTYRWLVQRLAVADIKGINTKLRKLADQIADKPLKKLRKRDDLLSYIWESMGLRVSSKDIPSITEILRNPDTANGLVRTLSICLSNIVEMEDSLDKKKELGDKIFDAVPEKRRAYLTVALAQSCSPKALDYFKQRATDPKNWVTDQDFFSNYPQDDIVPYLQHELLPLASDNDRNKKLVENMIAGVLRQNRDRSLKDAQKLIKHVYEKIDVDTSEWSSIMEKVDPDSGAFIGEDNPQYKELLEKSKALEAARAQKIALVGVLSRMYDWPWVVQILGKYEKDSDVTLAAAARSALEKVKKNRSENDKIHSNYKRRTQE